MSGKPQLPFRLINDLPKKRNPYLLFVSAYKKKNNHRKISPKELSLTWKEMPEEKKEKYKEDAETEKQEFEAAQEKMYETEEWKEYEKKLALYDAKTKQDKINEHKKTDASFKKKKEKEKTEKETSIKFMT